MAVNGFTCPENRRHHHGDSASIAIPLVAGYRDSPSRLSPVAALEWTAALLRAWLAAHWLF
jgi:hypothetical protein